MALAFCRGSFSIGIMDIHHLKIFVAVYQNRSFSKASAALFISQPTISEHIKNLELELDCKLFDRLGRTILPTAEADIILPQALQVIEELGRVGEILHSSRGAVTGRLTVGASTIPGTYLLPAEAATFKEANPQVSFEICIHDTAQVAELVAGHELFLGVVGAKVSHKQLNMTPFYQDELVCAGRAEFAQQVKEGRDITRHPFLLREHGSGTRIMMGHFLGKMGISEDNLQVAAILGSTAAIKEALKAALGISILAKKAIEEELKSGELTEIPFFPQPMVRDFYLLSHKKRTLPAGYQAFYEHLIAV